MVSYIVEELKLNQIQPKYYEHPDICIRHLECAALYCIIFEKSWKKMEEVIPEYVRRAFYWLDHFNAKAKDKHKSLRQKLYAKSITSMDAFYRELDKLLKPKSLGKMIKDKKKRTAQSAYQKEQLGAAFIDNTQLLSQAKQTAFQLAEERADKDIIEAKAHELVKEYSKEELPST